jgi:hypothetical protein
MMKNWGALTIAACLVTGTAVAQTPQPAAPKSPAGAMQMRSIDCPPTSAAPAAKSGAVGTPQGAGQGSGLTTMPSKSQKQIEGQIKAISSTRTNRVVEVADVKLEVEPATAVLVDCKTMTVADLKAGQKVKALYEVKENNRNVATVIEAQR